MDAIYPLILECGRPIAPRFRTRAQLAENAAFRENVVRDGIRIFPR